MDLSSCAFGDGVLNPVTIMNAIGDFAYVLAHYRF